MNNKLNTLNLTDEQTEAILARIKAETEYSPYYDDHTISLYDGEMKYDTDYNLGYDSGSYYVSNVAWNANFNNIDEAVDHLIQQLNFYTKEELREMDKEPNTFNNEMKA